MLGGLEANSMPTLWYSHCVFVGVLNRRHEVHSNRSRALETLLWAVILGLVSLGRVLFPEITASETCGVLFTELEFSLGASEREYNSEKTIFLVE